MNPLLWRGAGVRPILESKLEREKKIMKIAKNLNKNVFCLEGDWEKDLRDKSSVSAALDFLHSNCGIEYIHKNCGTVDNMKYYLSLWKQKRYQNYTIAYLAF